MAKKIFGYARVSTQHQNLDRQLHELKKYVKNEENIYIDKQSGKDFRRVAYQKMKAAARDGDEIYIKSLDRLGRNKQQIKDELQALQITLRDRRYGSRPYKALERGRKDKRGELPNALPRL